MLLGKQLTEITENDLHSLVDNEVAESRELEYKLTLPGNAREDRIEFLADVASFANSAGGVILYGIDEERDANGNTTGIPREVCGLPGINTDVEIRRLENIIRDGVDPRIAGVRTHLITLVNDSIVLALEVPRSWNRPHAVNYQRHWRFYYRDSAGKHPMDVSEVRNLFSVSEGVSEQVRNFRVDRLSRIDSGLVPVRLKKGAKLVLHLIPLEAFTPGKTVDIASNETTVRGFKFVTGDVVHRYNLDGALNYWAGPGSTVAKGYTQVFRNGIIETVDTSILDHQFDDGTYYIASPGVEKGLINVVKWYLGGLMALGVAAPVFGYITLMGVNGYILAYRLSQVSRFSVDRGYLGLPELFIEDLVAAPEVILKPAFDALWNAVGAARCELYDEDGQWMSD